jgi:hypothetical protein
MHQFNRMCDEVNSGRMDRVKARTVQRFQPHSHRPGSVQIRTGGTQIEVNSQGHCKRISLKSAMLHSNAQSPENRTGGGICGNRECITINNKVNSVAARNRKRIKPEHRPARAY